MRHHTELADHEAEHVVAELWTLEDERRPALAELRGLSRFENIDETLERLIERKLLRRRGDDVALTDSGREMAARVLRRLRLAEMLLSAVLQVEDRQVVDQTACVMEHVLHSSVTDSVCAFLGHPKFCPHGKPIPPGPCCRTFSNAIEPLVQPLEQLRIGQTARVVYIVPKDPQRLMRLSSLGLVPGTTLRLQQKRPASVVVVGETTLALDHDIAREIYVKQVDPEP